MQFKLFIPALAAVLMMFSTCTLAIPVHTGSAVAQRNDKIMVIQSSRFFQLLHGTGADICIRQMNLSVLSSLAEVSNPPSVVESWDLPFETLSAEEQSQEDDVYPMYFVQEYREQESQAQSPTHAHLTCLCTQATREIQSMKS